MLAENPRKYLLCMLLVFIGLLFSGCIHRTSEFEKHFPRPQWWDTVSDEKKINSYDELQLSWEENANKDPKKFIKAAYKAIIEHPDDVDILMVSIHLFPYCDPSYPHLVPLLEFALDKHFNYRDRRCGASPADTVAGIVEDLAKQYIERREYDKAVAVVEHLLSSRKAEVNDHLLEFLSMVYGRALFAKGKEVEAIQVLKQAITDYNGAWEKALGEQLAMYQEEMLRRKRKQ